MVFAPAPRATRTSCARNGRSARVAFHGRELDVSDGAVRAGDHAGRELEHVVVVAAELMGELHLARVDEDVDPGTRGAGNRLRRRVDVPGDAARKAADARVRT